MLTKKLVHYLTLLGSLGLWTTALAQDPAASIRHTSTPIVIDGNADDAAWASANEYDDFFTAGGEEPTGPEDISGKWRALWDEENLYFWIEVQDSEIFTEDTNEWTDDSVEIYIDSDSLGKGDDPVLDYRPDGDIFGPLDPAEAAEADPPLQPIYQLTIIAGQDKIYNGVNHRKWINALAGSEFDDMDQAPHLGVTIKSDTGYTLEIAFPWVSLGMSGPTDILDRGSFGFGVALNDNDVGGTRQTQLMWGTELADLWNNPTQFPDVALLFPEGPGPDIFVKKAIDLGELSTDPQDLVLTVSNVGTDNPLIISDVTVSGPDADRVTITDFPASIAPSSVGDIKYKLTPGRTGAFQFTIEIASNDVDAEDQARSVAVTAAAINPAGPWGHYAMDEAEGSTEMFDITGRGNHGTFSGVTLGQDALATGNAAAFGGGSQGSIPGARIPLTNFTVSMWLNQTDSAGLQTLFGQGAGTPAFALLVNAGELSWFADDNIEFGASAAPLATGTTYHVAATYDESGASPSAVLYVNGEEVARKDNAANVDVDAVDSYYIGAFATNLPFNGILDDVQVYNRVLAPETIQELFATPGSVPGEIVSGGAFTQLWLLGDDSNGNQAEFSQEQGMDAAPGSATAQDDDFYFWGVYPAPIGIVTDNEPFTNYDRAHVPGDPFNRIHFNLDADSAAADTDLRMTFALCCFGAADAGPSEHDLVFRLNGKEFFSEDAIDGDRIIEEIVKAGDFDAVEGANTIEIERTGGSDSAWVQYDYVRLEASAGAPVPQPTVGEPVEGELPEGAHPLTATPTGDGLTGYYWLLEPKEIVTSGEPLHKAGDGAAGADNANSGWADANIYNRENTGQFVATTFDYGGDDLTPIKEWLRDDADSFTGTEGNLDDGAFRMVGYVKVDAAGPQTFTTTSDDGSVVYVNDALVVSNDNGHGNATVSGTVNFPAAGYYPIDIRYFNGDWTNDAGDHGGANFIGDAGFENVVQGLEGIPAPYTPPAAVTGIDGLLGYWRFEEGSGATVADSSGNGNDGTIIEPGAAWVSDPALGSVYQSGGGSYVELGTLPVIGVDTDFTWSFWVNAGETDNNNIVLGNRWSPDGTDFAPREFVKFTPRVFEWHVDGAGQNMPGDNSMFVVDEWAHNLVVKTGATLTYYRNGAEIATSEIVSAPANAQPLYLGGQNGAEIFTGKFDEVAIFGRALSTDEVTDVYNRGLNGESLSGGDISPPPPRAPEITGVSKTAAGVALQLPAGTTYDIEYSSDLRTWSVIASDVTDNYSDADAGRVGGPEGYYRGVVK